MSLHSSSNPFSPPTVNSGTPSSQCATTASPTASLNAAPSSHLAELTPLSVGRFQPLSPSFVVPDTNSSCTPEVDILASTNASPVQDVDPQILEALKSKDRIYVLKLGELMEELINERRVRIDLTPATSYQRLLVHRCSAYYKLAPENDPVSKGIFLLPNAEGRIPVRRIAELVPAESTAQPAFKIMRRSQIDRRPKSQSQAGSVTGEDADLSDIEPSESGSLGGRSNATGGSNKKRMTIEEREAAYNEARSRIFMDFEEKEREKEKDISASSSSLSLVSGSVSMNGGGGSVDDLDEIGSSPATESEWSGPSGPLVREKDNRRIGSGNASASSSSRSLRGAPFTNSSSSRNSRAPSPSFTFATLYEPPPNQMYDQSQHFGPSPVPYHQSQYTYPYSPPAQHLNPPYVAPYPYYSPHHGPYPPPPHMQHNPSDAPNPSSEQYMPQHTAYNNSYLWQPNQPHPHLQSPPQMTQPPPPQQPHQQHTPHPLNPHPQSSQYQHYIAPPHAYTYPMNGYYPPQPQRQPLPPPAHHMPHQPMYDIPRQLNGNMLPNNGNGHGNIGSRPVAGNGSMAPPNGNGHGRMLSRNPASDNVNGCNDGLKSHSAPPFPPQARSAWSYGPGVGIGGHVAPNVGADAVGPRLNPTRRPSGNSASSNTSRASSNCDDVSSTASSSTASSSSRRTYTSTASSQHPLPPRPDWAVGLKAQPTLAGRHHDHSLSNSRTMSPISPPRGLNGGGSPHPNLHSRSHQHSAPVSLQSTDFPPLTLTQERRAPVAAGAWGNASSNRSILQPGPGNSAPSVNALVQHSPKVDDSDRSFERPPPKSAELFNPKVVRRPFANGNSKAQIQVDKDKDRLRGDAVANAILVGQISSMSIEEQNNTDSSSVSAHEQSPMTT